MIFGMQILVHHFSMGKQTPTRGQLQVEWMNYYCISNTVFLNSKMSHLNCGKSLYCIPNHSFRWKTRTEQNFLMSRRMSLFPFLVVVIQITFYLVTASVANTFVCPVLGSFDPSWPSETLWLQIQFKMSSGRCWNEIHFRKQKI